MTADGDIMFYFVEMPRKKRIVEGITLNLDDFMSSDVSIDTTLLVETKTETVKKINSHKKTKTNADILAAIHSKYHCDTCKRYIYSSYVRSWRGRYLCDKCYTDVRKDISPELTAYIKDIYSRGCAFCNVTVGRFHFDHINMFSKVNSVMAMVNAGESEEDIKTEIAKCQLLCADCHMVVTRVELRSGFIRQKTKLTRMIAAGKDVTELRQALYDEYDAFMKEMYPLIREKVCEVACVGDLVEASGRGIGVEFSRHGSGVSCEVSRGVCD